jgi:tetratricopeptide (TPR) repeat protein
MTWEETKQRLLEAAQTIRQNKVLDAGTRALLASVPVVGGFAERMWDSIDAGDDERATQIAALLEAAARQQADFEQLKRKIDEQGDTLLATHASVDDILGRVTVVQASVTRVEAKLDALFAHLEAEPVKQALHAEVVLANDLDAASDLIHDADRALADAGQDLSPENLFRLGVVYQATGNNEQAKASFLAVTERDPTNAAAYTGLASVLQLEANTMVREENFGLADISLRKAAAYAEKALALDNTNVQVLVQMGYNEKELAQRYVGAGRASEAAVWIDKARAHFRMALGVDDANAGAHNGLGSIAMVLGDYDEAIAECERAIALEPMYLSAHHDLAGALYGKAVASSSEQEEVESLHAFLAQLQRVFSLDGDPGAGRQPPDATAALRSYGNWATRRLETLTGERAG